jgi:hypothetical protein
MIDTKIPGTHAAARSGGSTIAVVALAWDTPSGAHKH